MRCGRCAERSGIRRLRKALTFLVKITAAEAGMLLVAGLSACSSSTDTASQNEQYCTASDSLCSAWGAAMSPHAEFR